MPTKGKRINVTVVNPDLLEKITIVAEAEKRTLANLGLHALAEYVKKHPAVIGQTRDIEEEKGQDAQE